MCMHLYDLICFADLQFAYPLFYEEISRPESILYVSSRRTLFTGLGNGTVLNSFVFFLRPLSHPFLSRVFFFVFVFVIFIAYSHVF